MYQRSGLARHRGAPGWMLGQLFLIPSGRSASSKPAGSDLLSTIRKADEWVAVDDVGFIDAAFIQGHSESECASALPTPNTDEGRPSIKRSKDTKVDAPLLKAKGKKVRPQAREEVVAAEGFTPMPSPTSRIEYMCGPSDGCCVGFQQSTTRCRLPHM